MQAFTGVKNYNQAKDMVEKYCKATGKQVYSEFIEYNNNNSCRSALWIDGSNNKIAYYSPEQQAIVFHQWEK